MGAAWAESGRPELAARCRSLAGRLGAALRRAVRRLAGAAFRRHAVRPRAAARRRAALRRAHRVARRELLEPRHAVRARLRALPAARREARDGSSATCSRTARGCSGSCVPARTRSTARPPVPTSGTDQVYGLNVAALPRRQRPARPARAQPLRAARRRDDARNVRRGRGGVGRAARRGAAYRTMYLPPNGASNAAFLETLRLMLVHETTGADGTPAGLELAYATPRRVARARAGRSRCARRRRASARCRSRSTRPASGAGLRSTCRPARSSDA